MLGRYPLPRVATLPLGTMEWRAGDGPREDVGRGREGVDCVFRDLLEACGAASRSFCDEGVCTERFVCTVGRLACEWVRSLKEFNPELPRCAVRSVDRPLSLSLSSSSPISSKSFMPLSMPASSSWNVEGRELVDAFEESVRLGAELSV